MYQSGQLLEIGVRSTAILLWKQISWTIGNDSRNEYRQVIAHPSHDEDEGSTVPLLDWSQIQWEEENHEGKCNEICEKC